MNAAEFCEVLISTQTENLSEEAVTQTITCEVNNITSFYVRQGLLTVNQADAINKKAIQRLVRHWVTDINKIKLMVKDYVIFMLSREFKNLKRSKILEVIF